MKNRNYFLICFLFFALYAKSQCILDAGSDVYFCSDNSTSSGNFIGNNVQLFNAVHPVSFSWNAFKVITIGSHTIRYHASDFLDDTTSLNPEIIFPMDNIVFNLTVVDSSGNSCTDSLVMHHFPFYIHLGNLEYTILKGDSIFLNFSPNLNGGVAPFKYLWRPNHGLRDSTTGSGFWAKPEKNIKYYLNIEDSKGCKQSAPWLYSIIVNSIGIDEELKEKNISISPNPSSGLVKIDMPLNLELKSISILTMQGQVVYSFGEEILEFDISELPTGFYLLNIECKEGFVRKKIKKM